MGPVEWFSAAMLVILPALCGGCYSSFQIESADGMAALSRMRAEKGPSSGPIQRVSSDVDVKVASAASWGCVLVPTVESVSLKELGALGCTVFPLSPGHEDDELKAKADSQHSNLTLRIRGVDHDLATLLEQHLARRFRHASVSVVPTTNPEALAVASAAEYGGSPNGMFGAHKAVVTLTATRAADAPITGQGKGEQSVSTGNLGWEVPVWIVTLPIGFIITPPIQAGMEKRAAASGIVQALDNAAEDLASKMAARAARSDAVASAWQVKVAFDETP